MKNSYLTGTDQFCGCGGSSQGAEEAGLEVKVALNHWELAVKTHNTNFPNALHDCTDVSACDPRRYPSTNFLITSPECTNHSLAKGVKAVKKQMDLFRSGKLDPAAERSRATMWDVPRFAEYHNYEIVITENVVDARTWVMFDAWIHAMRSLGYNFKCVYANSMFFWPTPQSRDRMYVVFWKKGNKAPKLDYMPLSYCPACDKQVNAIQHWKNPERKFGKYKQQYVYRCPCCAMWIEPYYYAAFNCIDWSDIGTRIGDRKKPLSPNSTRRIQYGIDNYGDEAFIINDQHSTGIDYRVSPMLDKMDTVTTVPNLKLIRPFILKEENANQVNVRSSMDALQTQTTWQSYAMTVPMIIDGNYNPKPSRVSPVTSEFPAFTTQHRTGLASIPFIVENKGESNSRSSLKPLSCVTTKDYQGLITTESFNSFITSYYNGSHCIKHFTEPVGTQTVHERHSLVTYQKPRLEDCYYRMLKPHEIQSAMAFQPDYTVLGSGKDKVKQLGNAVTPPVMKWLIQQCIESLT